ncbi:GNAT family N-acetyltransferase [uncultured Hoeflea sp.]|uniref:GNAT family N-acetyltransferase n=1 Tax=uncultured Hoeflea sp. TaxID=538666 RepID=UPI0026254344|nr:GNAT family N-acetyltransferase [uncultured Hoeflea sp.]
MTNSVDIRLAGPEDAEVIARMLTSLAETIGDGAKFASTPDIIRRYGFSADALFLVLIADGSGLSLFFPHFSTTRGQPGVYVQDLWVDLAARGQNLGTRLLAATAAHATQSWGAEYIALTTHDHNDAARRFYHHLGFTVDDGDTPMYLAGSNYRSLGEKLTKASDPTNRS